MSTSQTTQSTQNTQTPSDYKDYFHTKFVNSFKDLVGKLINMLPDSSDEHRDLVKISNLMDKLNYDKIIIKLAENSTLMEVLLYMSKNNFNEEICEKFLSKNEKYWSLMPSFNINKIFMKLKEHEHRVFLQEQLNTLHVCAVTYNKVMEQMKNTNEGDSFNPFDSVGKVADNLDINTLFEGVEVKNISAYEMLMENIINQQMDNKMSDYMSNIKEDDVNEAAAKLNDVLNSDKFKSNKQTTKILSDMLNNIKSEVINLKGDGDKMKGKQGVEQLLGIAQKVAGNMMGTIKDSNVSVLDIWDATSNLAKNTVQSDALNIVDNLIRSNIENNLRRAQGMDQSAGGNPTTSAVDATEEVDGKDEKEERKKRRDKKKKDKKRE
jgi:hypothetical protein